jgi:hypothetical protein
LVLEHRIADLNRGPAVAEFLIQKDKTTNCRARIWGIVLLVAGLLLAKYQIYDPLHAAEQGKREVSLNLLFVAAAVYVPLGGLLLMMFGLRLKFDPRKLSLKNVLCLLAFGAVGVVAIHFVLVSLESQGYIVMPGGWPR